MFFLFLLFIYVNTTKHRQSTGDWCTFQIKLAVKKRFPTANDFTINTLLYSKCLAANGNVRVCKIFIPSNLLGGYNVIQLKVKPEYFIFYSKGSFNVLKFEMTVINCNCFMSVYDLSPNPDSHTHAPILAMTQIGAVTSNAIHRIISLELSIYFDSVHQTNGTTIWNSEKEWRIYWPAGH